MFEIELSKKQLKFIKSLNNANLVVKKIKELAHFQTIKIENVKKMKGNWHGFYRLRVGDLRIIFYEKDETTIKIHKIGFRGNIYK